MSRARLPQMPALVVPIAERWLKDSILDETVKRHIRQYRDFTDRSTGNGLSRSLASLNTPEHCSCITKFKERQHNWTKAAGDAGHVCEHHQGSLTSMCVRGNTDEKIVIWNNAYPEERARQDQINARRDAWLAAGNIEINMSDPGLPSTAFANPFGLASTDAFGSTRAASGGAQAASQADDLARTQQNRDGAQDRDEDTHMGFDGTQEGDEDMHMGFEGTDERDGDLQMGFDGAQDLD
ncbi:hypothetical protein BDZ85DRAFT_267681 [Elsinoe ampelina]|uniref:Uncharacterized protein n=1 Tax=Elsinoe ampelina TaxID=302913 RepID=A0A6A6G2E7_9PEZI|nr:hypothetical protein BDZ85DRAFT_267681 [Elsinoe ampelina]